MKTLAIEINDIGLRGRSAEGEVFDSPGLALVDGNVLVGESVKGQERLQPGRIVSHFWSDLSLEALPATMRGAATVADLAFHHLNALWMQYKGDTERVILVVPGHYTREQLSLLLGIARECAMPVEGLVDLALMAAQRPMPGRVLIHIEMMLHRTVLTRLSQGRQLKRDQVASVEKVGQRAFHDAWAGAISNAFVRSTRYDPMHTAAAEQQFYERLPAWANALHRDGSATLAVDNNGREQSVVVRKDALVTAGEDLIRQIIRHISSMSRPGESLGFLLSDRLAATPGLHDALTTALPQCEIVDLPVAAAARGALRHADELSSSSDSVAYVTSVAWDRGANADVVAPSGKRPDGPLPPTHVVYNARAWSIDTEPLQIGAASQTGQRTIIVSGDTQGVSDRHCSVVHEGETTILNDHSRYGTFVNGRRVEGPTPLYYGDVVRLGTTDQSLQLIAVKNSDGA